MARTAHGAVSAYYTRRINRHGAVPAGVDWASEAAQTLRFAILLRLCDFAGAFSLDDVGCGYGALWRHLSLRHAGAAVDYLGFDLSAAMIRHARAYCPDAAFLHAAASPRRADYAVASGIFNVVPAGMGSLWPDLVAKTLDDLWAGTRRGFAVNFLAPGPTTPRLYRTPPGPWRDHCTTRYAASIDVLAAYGLNEFTLLVRRRTEAARAPG